MATLLAGIELLTVLGVTVFTVLEALTLGATVAVGVELFITVSTLSLLVLLLLVLLKLKNFELESPTLIPKSKRSTGSSGETLASSVKLLAKIVLTFCSTVLEIESATSVLCF